MITMQWWELIGFVLLNNILISLASGIISTIRHYRRTCPEQATLSYGGTVRCFKRLASGECPDHGRVR